MNEKQVSGPAGPNDPNGGPAGIPSQGASDGNGGPYDDKMALSLMIAGHAIRQYGVKAGPLFRVRNGKLEIGDDTGAWMATESGTAVFQGGLWSVVPEPIPTSVQVGDATIAEIIGTARKGAQEAAGGVLETEQHMDKLAELNAANRRLTQQLAERTQVAITTGAVEREARELWRAAAVASLANGQTSAVAISRANEVRDAYRSSYLPKDESPR